MSGTTQSLQDTAIQAASAYGVPTNLFLAQIGAESGWNPAAVNKSSGATGLGQFIPSTAKAFGIDPTDPNQSLYAAAQYDAQLFAQTGSWSNALDLYSGQPQGATPYANNSAVQTALNTVNDVASPTTPTIGLGAASLPTQIGINPSAYGQSAPTSLAIGGAPVPPGMTAPGSSGACGILNGGIFTWSCWQGIAADMAFVGIGAILLLIAFGGGIFGGGKTVLQVVKGK